MDLTFQKDFSPVKKYTIIHVVEMMEYIDQLLDGSAPIATGISEFQSYINQANKIQFYFCLKAGTMSYLNGNPAKGMICYALIEALKEKFPSTIKPFESYKTSNVERYADILASPFWLTFLQDIQQVEKNGDIDRLDYLFADIAASALAHNDIKATLQVCEFRQMLYYYISRPIKSILQVKFKLQSSNLGDAWIEQEKIIAQTFRELPSDGDEVRSRKVSKDRREEMARLGLPTNITSALDIYHAAEKAIMLAPIYTNKKFTHDVFVYWLYALLNLCKKDIRRWRVADNIFESLDQLIEIYDDRDLRKMYLFYLAKFEGFKAECVK